MLYLLLLWRMIEKRYQATVWKINTVEILYDVLQLFLWRNHTRQVYCIKALITHTLLSLDLTASLNSTVGQFVRAFVLFVHDYSQSDKQMVMPRWIQFPLQNFIRLQPSIAIQFCFKMAANLLKIVSVSFYRWVTIEGANEIYCSLNHSTLLWPSLRPDS